MIRLFLLVNMLLLTNTTTAYYFISSDLTIGSTSDDIDYSIFNLSTTRDKNDLFWNYQNEEGKKDSLEIATQLKKQKGNLLDFSYHDITFSYAYKFSKRVKITPEIGIYKLKNFDESVTKSNLSLRSEFIIIDSLTTTLYLKDGLLSDQVFLTRGNPQTILGKMVSLNSQLQLFNKKLHTDLKLNSSKLMFETKRKELDLQFMYLVSSYPHWIRLGAGYNKMKYNKSSNQYWSPETFSAYGPRLDLSFLVLEKLQYVLGANYNWFKENKGETGTGYYLQTGLLYGLRDNWQTSLMIEKGESLQNGNKWTSESIKLMFNIFIE